MTDIVVTITVLVAALVVAHIIFRRSLEPLMIWLGVIIIVILMLAMVFWKRS